MEACTWTNGTPLVSTSAIQAHVISDLYRNWTDIDFRLMIIRDSIVPHIERVFTQFQSDILRKHHLQAQVCIHCKAKHVSNDKLLQLCPIGICHHFVQEIAKMKRIGFKSDWDKTHIGTLSTCAFDIALFYFNGTWLESPFSTDCVAYVQCMYNCILFSFHQLDKDDYHLVTYVRNETCHSGRHQFDCDCCEKSRRKFKTFLLKLKPLHVSDRAYIQAGLQQMAALDEDYFIATYLEPMAKRQKVSQVCPAKVFDGLGLVDPFQPLITDYWKKNSDVTNGSSGQLRVPAVVDASRLSEPEGRESTNGAGSGNPMVPVAPEVRLQHNTPGLNIASERAKKRLCNELRLLRQSPVEGFELSIDEGSMMLWNGLIIPNTAPYNGGAFKVRIGFPAGYPFEPPSISMETKIYHPNVDSNGFIQIL